MVSQWSVIEIDQHVADQMNDFELNLCIGGRYKLLENYSENLMKFPEAAIGMGGLLSASQSLELEFDPTDPNRLFFSTSEGLYKLNRRAGKRPTQMECPGLGAPTALSCSDNKFLLVGFACGSIAIFDKEFSAPLTVWYYTTSSPIT